MIEQGTTHQQDVPRANGNDGATEESQETRIYLGSLFQSEVMNYQPLHENVLVGDCHIVRGNPFLIAGPPGVGKSRASLALAVVGVTRKAWFGLPVHRAFCTYILQSENSLHRLKTELTEINEPKLEGKFKITPPPPYGLCFQRREFRDQLRAELENFPPDIFIIDPWNAVARDDRAKDYLETFDYVRQVIPAGDNGPAIGIWRISASRVTESTFMVGLS
jgi:hypothetical protein